MPNAWVNRRMLTSLPENRGTCARRQVHFLHETWTARGGYLVPRLSADRSIQ